MKKAEPCGYGRGKASTDSNRPQLLVGLHRRRIQVDAHEIAYENVFLQYDRALETRLEGALRAF